MFDHYSDVELVSKLQDFLLVLKTGFNKAGMPQYNKGCTESQEVCEQAIIYCDLIVKELESRLAMYDTEHTAFASVAEAVLTQRFRDDNNRKEWALVSKKPDKKTGKRRVLYWFGTKKPSEEEFKEQERRVQYFKHKG